MSSVDANCHNVYINNRSGIEITGINDVRGFTDSVVEAEYSDGNIAVEGSDLKIIDFSSQTGLLKISGTVNAVYYYGVVHKKRKRVLNK